MNTCIQLEPFNQTKSNKELSRLAPGEVHLNNSNNKIDYLGGSGEAGTNVCTVVRVHLRRPLRHYIMYRIKPIVIRNRRWRYILSEICNQIFGLFNNNRNVPLRHQPHQLKATITNNNMDFSIYRVLAIYLERFAISHSPTSFLTNVHASSKYQDAPQLVPISSRKGYYFPRHLTMF